jgi:DNA-binding XRE family transcriptional regulator
LIDILYFIPKQSKAIMALTPATLTALETMGSHLALARVRRRESLATRAKRIGVSVPTVMKIENGDPTVSMGAYAQALWLVGRDGELARIAAPEFDQEAIARDVAAAVTLGKKRARSASAGHAQRTAKQRATQK